MDGGLLQVHKLWLFVLQQEEMISVAVLDAESFHIPISWMIKKPIDGEVRSQNPLKKFQIGFQKKKHTFWVLYILVGIYLIRVPESESLWTLKISSIYG